ncbi:ABC transporter permease [Xanthobacter pseudotagetidis]|uniref:ABC transporter permease n=1 Tax=Xanthobacter pseudotagetidis TaxID=3119911 RepID=UPI0037283A49
MSDVSETAMTKPGIAPSSKSASAGSVPARRRRRRNALDSTLGRSALQIAAVVGFFLLWELAVDVGWANAFLVGKPSGIISVLVSSIADGSLFVDTGYTVFEALLGFAFGTVIGSLIGLALWYSVFVARLTEPFIAAINSVPKIALAPIIILWFGTGLTSKVALAVSLTAIVALITAYQAAKDADKDLQALLFSMGADKHRIFKRVIVPSTLPAIIATFRINIGFALVGAVVGEFISSQHGLGHLIYTASSLYDLNSVWAGLFVLMLVGFVFYHMVELTERWLLPWKQEQHSTQINV